MEEIRFVVDQHGVIHALMSDGTYQSVLVNVQESAWYGYLSINCDESEKALEGMNNG